MGHGLGLSVVAEGVETLEQLHYLRTHNCDYAQGFLLSRPVEADQATELLKGPLAVALQMPTPRQPDSDEGSPIPGVLPSLEASQTRRLFAR
jgi:predicted signal transduction protein with EAL and GGDEF domain